MKIALSVVYGLFLLFIGSLTSHAQMNIFEFTTPGTFNFVVPAGVTEIEVFLVGGGGGGGSGNQNFALGIPYCDYHGGGGGGGETTVTTLAVVPGETLNVLVALNGQGGVMLFGGTGQSTTISRTGMVLARANGGFGGLRGTDCNTHGNGGLGGTGGGGTAGGAGAPGSDSGGGGQGGNPSVANSANAGRGGRGGTGDEGKNGLPGTPGYLRITILGTNEPPIASNDTYIANTDDILFIPAPGILANDSDPDGDPLIISILSEPVNGTLDMSGNSGGFFYIPNDGFSGIDSFTYQISDGVDTAEAIVTITVVPTGTNAPIVRAVLPTNIIRVGDVVPITMVLENPFLAEGGGINALETDCEITPSGILIGLNVASLPNIFTPDPAVVNPGFTANSWLYAVSQSGGNPPVDDTGSVYQMTLRATGQGTAVLNCTATAINAVDDEVLVVFIGGAINVENIAPGTGNVTGQVLHSHKAPGGSTVTLLNAGNTVVVTGTTAADGSFTLPGVPVGTYTIRAESPGYMRAEGSVTVLDQQSVTKSAVTLLAGDLVTTTPIVIDELDVVQLAISYGQTVPPASPNADLNGDSVVGLADLRALAEHLRLVGPTVWN